MGLFEMDGKAAKCGFDGPLSFVFVCRQGDHATRGGIVSFNSYKNAKAAPNLLD